MEAEGPCRHPHPGAVHGMNASVFHEFTNPGSDQVRSRDERSWLVARHKESVGFVTPVRKCFRPNFNARLGGQRRHPPTGHCKNPPSSKNLAHHVEIGQCKFRSRFAQPIQGSVQLDVLHVLPNRPGHVNEPGHLVDDQSGEFAGCHRGGPSAKPSRQTGMRPQAHTVEPRQLDTISHAGVIARVAAASDVG